MILRRMTHHMKADNWTNVAIEFVLVVLGVFLGIVAANWNEERLERRETERLLTQLDAELNAWVAYQDGIGSYYDSVRTYSQRAERGWAGDPTVSDREFVIAAYQASQINGVANNGAVWGAIFGAENLRHIEDRVVRETLARLMTYDFDLVSIPIVSTRYREEVRKVIPNDIQSAVRNQCGDRVLPDGTPALPETCDLQLAPGEARRTADALRARPELAAELNWHQAAVANQLANIATLREFANTLASRIGAAPSQEGTR